MRKVLVSLSLLIIVLVCTCSYFSPAPKPVVFSAFSDNAFAMWGLTLYKDSTFYETLPASDNEGRYILNGDTIILQREEENLKLPQGYIVDRKKGQIYEAGKWGRRWIDSKSGNWSSIALDSIPK